MRVLVVPIGLFGGQTTAQAGAQAAAGWGVADKSARCQVFVMSGGGRGFAGEESGPVAQWGQCTLIDGNAFLPPPAHEGMGRRPAGEYFTQPWARASSEPLGTAIAHVAGSARRIVVGLGETGSLDGGAGILAALAEEVSGGSCQVAGLAGGLVGLARLARENWRELKAVADVLAGVSLTVAYADDVPLLGMQGLCARLVQRRVLTPAAAQEAEHLIAAFEDAAVRGLARPSIDFGSGKGLGAGELPLAHRAATRPGSGAGGGAAFVLGLLGASLNPGAEWWAGEFGLASAVRDADLVLAIAERIDWRLADGVLPVLAREAGRRAVPLVTISRETGLTRTERADLGLAGSYEAGEAAPYTWTGDMATRVARTWARVGQAHALSRPTGHVAGR